MALQAKMGPYFILALDGGPATAFGQCEQALVRG